MGKNKNIEEYGKDDQNYSTFIMVNSDDYLEADFAILKKLIKNDSLVIYVNLNRTKDFLLKEFKKKKIQTKKLFFIDCISMLIDDDAGKKKLKNSIMIESPQNLKKLEKIITDVNKAMTGEKKHMVFDGISDLLIYNSKEDVLKFISGLTKKMEKMELRGIFLSTEKKIDSEMEKKLKPNFDKMIDLTGSIERKFARLVKM